LYGAIASGGMATVHFGRLIGPVGFSRTVAIKRLHAQFAADPEFVAMFLDEARLAARIRHPNVVPTLDVVAASGELFLVMDYVPGESLGRLVRTMHERTALVPTAVTVAIMAGVLQGLHAAHEARNEQGAPLGIVHRDVSPQNVLVGEDGQARVLDFGVAKAAGRVQTTREGQLKGKLAYMAPEQLRGEGLTRQTDIYAASVVLWEALTGERLFRADNEGAVVTRVLEMPVLPPSHVLAIPRDEATAAAIACLDPIVLRGLARDPQARFATAREMALALERAVHPATPSEVGEWVDRAARDVLQKRAEQVAEIESSSSTLERGAFVTGVHAVTSPTPLAPSDEAPATERAPFSPSTDVVFPETSGAGLSSISVSANNRGAEGARRWRSTLAVAVIVMAMAVPAGIMVFRRAPAAPTPLPPRSPEPTPSSAPVLSTPEPVPPPTESAPLAGDAPGTSRQDASAAKAALTPNVVKKIAPNRSAGSSCNPPFTYDKAGMKHYKPECL
jgi:serine/threonine protein kinase